MKFILALFITSALAAPRHTHVPPTPRDTILIKTECVYRTKTFNGFKGSGCNRFNRWDAVDTGEAAPLMSGHFFFSSDGSNPMDTVVCEKMDSLWKISDTRGHCK